MSVSKVNRLVWFRIHRGKVWTYRLQFVTSFLPMINYLDSLSDSSIFAILAFAFLNLLVTLLARDLGEDGA